MPGRYPLRYDATGALIRRGDVVVVPVGDKAVKGVVKHTSHKTRRVEVWFGQPAVARHQARWRSFRRIEVTPLPWLQRRDWPAQVERVA